MPTRAPHLCPCGHAVAFGERCTCQKRQDAARKARADRTRPNASERGYDAAWRKARAEFLRANPTCRRPGCGEPANVVDHIEPHRGNRALFWNRANWQPLCASCHSGAKQAEERRR
ncbi:MAG: HNH endonuclease signature motif containing protein [Salinarimonas sp.]